MADNAVIATLYKTLSTLYSSMAEVHKEMAKQYEGEVIPPPVVPKKAPLGINLAGIASISTEFPFNDLMKMASPFYSQITDKNYDEGMKETLDKGPRGWPLTLKPKQFAEAKVFEGMPFLYPIGDYTVTWEGQGTVQLAAGGQVQGTAITSGSKIRVTKQDANMIGIRITKTMQNNGIRNLQVRPPTFTSTFREQFISRWKGVMKAARFMDWQNASNDPTVKWTDRATVEDATYTTIGGVPIEMCMDAAEALDVNPWLCVPMAADDDYVANMATLVNGRLRDGKKVYIEYGNEFWNTVYPTYQYAKERGKVLNLDTNEFYAALKYYSLRSVEIFNIFRQAIGDDVVRVLAMHADNPWLMQTILDYRGADLYTDAIAIAPYWAHGDQFEDIPNITVEQILNRCSSLIEKNKVNLEQYAKLAKERKLRLIAYEGGQHMKAMNGSEDLVQKFIIANRNPLMKDLYLKDLRQWAEVGGDLFCMFSSVNKPGNHGSWGLLEYDGQDPNLAPKYQAALEYAKKRLI